MGGSYSFTPYSWPSLLTVILLSGLFAYVWPRRRQPGARPFLIVILFGAAWAACSVLEYAALDPAAKVFWVKFQALWQLPATTAITFFLLEYIRPGRWLTRRNLVVLSIAPLLLVLLVLTNDLHHLFWLGFQVGETANPLRGPAAWSAIAYGYALTILNLAIIIGLFVRSPQHRWPVAVIITGQLVLRVLYLMEVTNVLDTTLPLDILGIAFMDLMYTAVLFGFRLFDPVPMARRAAVEQMPAGMIVLDAGGRIASLNPRAERMLGVSARQLRGQRASEALPASAGLALSRPGEVETELSFPGNGRTYVLQVSPLTDFRGTEVSRLLLLTDISELKHAQAQIVAQQRSLAALKEREQLARELHDSTAQVLGYTGFQLETIHNNVQDGQAALSVEQAQLGSAYLASAEAQVTRLSSIIAEAHADVREYILNLRLAPSDQRPFFAALQQYLDGFCLNYEIQTLLTVGAGIDDHTFGPDVQMQLFRIIQETLSNARKHAAASRVTVAFERDDSRVRIRMQDDGRGFDPLSVECSGEKHFGLCFMRERAEQIGGSLEVRSAPGEGTCVEVIVPVSAQPGG